MVASGMNMLWASKIVKLSLEPTTLSQLSTLFNQLNAHIGSVTTFGEIGIKLPNFGRIFKVFLRIYFVFYKDLSLLLHFHCCTQIDKE